MTDQVDTPGPATAPASWRADAACTGCDPALFYIERGEPSAPARIVCAGCPVNVDCLTDALDHGEQFGIWGGLAPDDRQRIISTTGRSDYRATAERAVGAMTARVLPASGVCCPTCAAPPGRPCHSIARRAGRQPDRYVPHPARQLAARSTAGASSPPDPGDRRQLVLVDHCSHHGGGSSTQPAPPPSVGRPRRRRRLVE